MRHRSRSRNYDSNDNYKSRRSPVKYESSRSHKSKVIHSHYSSESRKHESSKIKKSSDVSCYMLLSIPKLNIVHAFRDLATAIIATATPTRKVTILPIRSDAITLNFQTNSTRRQTAITTATARNLNIPSTAAPTVFQRSILVDMMTTRTRTGDGASPAMSATTATTASTKARPTSP